MNYKKVVNNSLVQYIFFAVLASGVNILVYLFTYNILIKNIIVCNLIAYTFSLLLSFRWNKNIVFKNSNRVNLKQIFLFLLGKLISFGIDSFVLIVCNKILLLKPLWSKVISNCSTIGNNYIFNKKFVFKEKNK